MQIKTNFEFVRSKIATVAGEVVNDISDNNYMHRNQFY